MRLTIMASLALFAFTPLAHAAPTDAQKCESALELASAKYAQCRLNAESRDTKKPDPVKLAAALAKCSQKLSDAFAKATDRYGVDCAATEPSSAFDAYLAQCSDDATAAAAGAGLPDYAGELVSCGADLTTCEGDLATCEAQPQGKAPKTGQTTCYDTQGSVIACAGTGQDGETQNGLARSFTDNGDGTITDNNSGLMWEKLSDDGSIHDKDTTYSWANAFASKVATLNGTSFAGYDDWRVPSVAELETLKNFGAYSPAVYSTFNTDCVAACTVATCSCTQSGYYWSSTTFRSAPANAWHVSHIGGATDGSLKTSGLYVRAVRAGS
jgi:hypothetical protein